MQAEAAIDELGAFLDACRAHRPYRQMQADYGLYGRLKRDLERAFPDLSCEDYDRAIRVISGVCGV